MTLARSVFTSLAALALLAGCSGTPVGSDLTSKPDPTDPTEPTDPTPPTDPTKCTALAPACDPGDLAFGSDSACRANDAAYCYSRTDTCSKAVLWCGHPRQPACGAIPRCDTGDSQVSACPSGGPGNGGNICYPRTVCGTTILCFHQGGCTALPKCDPGDTQVGDPSQCFKTPPLTCYKRAVCNVTITCAKP